MEPLDRIERDSPLWKKLKDHIEKRIDSLQKLNEKVGLEDYQTNAYRGAIQELRSLLAKAEPAPLKTTRDKPLESIDG